MHPPISISSAQHTHAHTCPNRDGAEIRIPIASEVCPYCRQQLGGGPLTLDATSIQEETDRVINFLSKTARVCWGIVFGMPR
jgi:hypothetical protein